MAEAVEGEVILGKHESRTSAVRSCGIDASKMAKEAMNMSKIARLGHTAPPHTPQQTSQVQSASLMCPRCKKVVSMAKLSHGEEAGYCASCRYAMPLASDE